MGQRETKSSAVPNHGQRTFGSWPLVSPGPDLVMDGPVDGDRSNVTPFTDPRPTEVYVRTRGVWAYEANWSRLANHRTSPV